MATKNIGAHVTAYRDLIKPHTIDFELSRFLVEAMERVDNCVAKGNRNFRGASFELACVDMFEKQGVSKDFIVPALKMKQEWPGINEHDIDLDVCLVNRVTNEYIAFLLKTSLRERWKQHDRDAGLANGYIDWKMLDVCSIIFNEENSEDKKKKDSLRWETHLIHLPKLRKRSEEFERKCVTRMSGFSIYDTGRLDNFFLNSIKRITT